MPYAIRKVKGGYEVINRATGKRKAKHASRKNAAAQVRLLNAIEHGYDPKARR